MINRSRLKRDPIQSSVIFSKLIWFIVSDVILLNQQLKRLATTATTNTETIMNTIDFSQSVYVIEDETIEEMTLQEYLESFWSDNTTTPFGIRPRLHIRTDRGDAVSELHKGADHYEIWTYGVNGNNLRKEIYDVYWTAAEAHRAILKSWLHDANTKSNSNPGYFTSIKEAQECQNELLHD
jgi:hypothetical protein